MYHPNELISDIQERMTRMIRDYRDLIIKIKNLETENKSLAQSLEEAIKQQEILSKRLDSIHHETLRDTKGLDNWKNETRKEVRGILKEVEKCIPQVESLMEQK